MTKFTDFNALAAFLEEARDQGHDTSDTYSANFIEAMRTPVLKGATHRPAPPG